MILLPSRAYYSKDVAEATRFSNYNQEPFIDCFKTFPRNTAIYVLNHLIDFLNGNDGLNTKINAHNLSIEDILFTKCTMEDIVDHDGNRFKADIEEMINKDQIRTLSVKFNKNTFLRFYYFDNYSFIKPDRIKNRNIIDADHIEHEQYHQYISTYAISTMSIGDVRMINFFIDESFNDPCNWSRLFIRVIDSMVMEHLKISTDSSIPFNRLSHHTTAFIIFPNFLTIDGIIFIYNYFHTIFELYGDTTYMIPCKEGFKRYGTMSMRDYMIMLKDSGLDEELFNHGIISGVYFEPFWKILVNDVEDRDSILVSFYEGYRTSMLGEREKVN